MNSVPSGPLSDSIVRYLAHKRSLGKELAKVGPMLSQLNSYLAAHGVNGLGEIRTEHVQAFLDSCSRPSPRSYNGLIGALRGLFRWIVTHQLLSASPLPSETRRVPAPRRPFLFTPDQARGLLEATQQLPSTFRAQGRGDTYRMIFALLYGLGLRVGELSRLCRKDLDFDCQLLVIRETKFGKSRLVPFGPKMARAMTAFLEQEESRYGPIPSEGAIFSFNKQKRTPLSTSTISWTFHKLLPALQLTVPSGVRPPHLHCLRHSFAVGTLLRWYRAGVDPMERLLDLSTFLGHVSPSSTAVYLTITTELLECANSRFGHFAERSRKESLR